MPHHIFAFKCKHWWKAKVYGFKREKFLTEDQARHIYKKVESGNIINIDTLEKETDQDWELHRLNDTSGDINPYRELIVNNAEKLETVLSQMEQWSVLSNVVNYIQYDRHPKIFYNLNIRAVNKEKYKRKSNIEEERQVLVLDFGDMPDKLKEEYLDVYDGIQSEILSTTRFDENSDLSTTYLGRIDMIRTSKIKVKEMFPISEQGYTVGKLLDGTECQILLDTGASESFMSKSHYLHCKSLYSIPKFASKTQRIWGNGQFISVLFIIPIIIDIHGHRFRVNTLVSEIHENVDLVLGIKNIFELEGVINSWDCYFNFLNRSIPIFPKECSVEIKGTKIDKGRSTIHRWNFRISHN